jgi:hypothetical protein
LQVLVSVENEKSDNAAVEKIKDSLLKVVREKIDKSSVIYKVSLSTRESNQGELFLTFQIPKKDLDFEFLERINELASTNKILEWGIEASGIEDVFLAIIEKSKKPNH